MDFALSVGDVRLPHDSHLYAALFPILLPVSLNIAKKLANDTRYMKNVNGTELSIGEVKFCTFDGVVSKIASRLPEKGY